MKYYSSPFESFQSSSVSEASVANYNGVVEKLKTNYHLNEVLELSKKLPSLTKELRNTIFYIYTNDIFDILYISRFVLPQQQFCEIQEFIFSNPQSKGGKALVPHLDTFFDYVQKSVLPCMSDTDQNILQQYYVAVKQSEISEFSINNLNLVDLTYPQLFYSDSHDTTQFYDFVSFAKHTIAFNYFKEFLLNPSNLNSQYLFKLLDYINFKDNPQPRNNELWSFCKLMEQSHYNILAQLENTPNGLSFIEKAFFFPTPRPNSKGPFYNPTYDENIVHTFNYDILNTLNKKNIDLNVFFDKTTEYKKFSSFVLDTINKKLQGTIYTYDKDGYEHLLSLLKIQDYFYLNYKNPPKGIDIKQTKI